MIPTVEFNIIFQLTHIYSHLMNEGIGLRQLVDYYYVLCDFYKVYQNFSPPPSSLTLKGGSTAFPKSLSNGLYTPFGSPVSGGQKPQGTGDVTAPPRRSEPLRSKVGGPKRSSPDCTGWDRLAVAGGDLMLHQSPRHGCAGWDRLGIAVYSLQLIVYRLQLIL